MDNPATKLAALDARCEAKAIEYAEDALNSSDWDYTRDCTATAANLFTCANAIRTLVPRADMAEGVELLREIYSQSDDLDRVAITALHRVPAFLARHAASDGGGA